MLATIVHNQGDTCKNVVAVYVIVIVDDFDLDLLRTNFSVLLMVLVEVACVELFFLQGKLY